MTQATRQPDLFAAHTPAPDPMADQIARAPDLVRARLAAMRLELDAATTRPLSAQRVNVMRIMLPNMTNWLPPGERDHVLAEFTTTFARLGISA